MGFLVSPGVEVKEIDLTNVIPAVSTAIGGFVGTFNWGPVEQPILVSSETLLADAFGTPDASNVKHFLTAASFLKYASSLKVSRAVRLDALNATDEFGTPILIKNRDHFETLTFTNQSVIARYPGTRGNSIKVQIADAVVWNYDWALNTVEATTLGVNAFKAQFDYAPSKTNATNGFNDEIHVLITDVITGEILEKFTGLSLATDAKAEDGSALYYKTVLNQSSNYIYAVDLGNHFVNADVGKSTTAGTAATGTYELGFGFGSVVADDIVTTSGTGVLEDGSIGEGLSQPAWQDAANVFADADQIDVSLLFSAESGSTAVKSVLETALETIALNRRDCVLFVSAPTGIATAASSAAKLTLATTKAGLFNSSYVVIDSTPVYVYNKYQDNYIWIPAAGHMAGLCARTDETNDSWFSPAGYNRGNLLGVTKVAFNPTNPERDELYKVSANPIVAFPGQGILLYGDKTTQKKPSAFDRINVRRLFITLEKAIATAAKYQLFEFNDEFTRSMFRNMTEPFLRDVQGRRGLTDFRVVCDETNNTSEVIDSNRFVASIFIKPARSINFITLNFIATRTGVEFSEIAGAA
jgi:phage tail sheath protein FI